MVSTSHKRKFEAENECFHAEIDFWSVLGSDFAICGSFQSSWSCGFRAIWAIDEIFGYEKSEIAPKFRFP